MRKTFIALSIAVSCVGLTQPVQAKRFWSKTPTVSRISNPSKTTAPVKTPEPPSQLANNALVVKPVQQQQVVQHQSGNSMSSAIGSAAIGAAAGVGTVMIADALLNDKQQPAQTTQPVQTPIAPVNETNTGLWFLVLVAFLIGIVALIGRSLRNR